MNSPTTRDCDWDNDNIGPLPFNHSTSSNKAVLGIGCSSSPDKSVSNTSYSPRSPLSGGSQVPPPSLASPNVARVGSTAVETPKDKVDDDAYGAWWFLASISESWDTLQSNSGKSKSGEQTTKISQLEMPSHATIQEEQEGLPSQSEGIEVDAQSAQFKGMEANAQYSKTDNAINETTSWKHSDASPPRDLSQQTKPQHPQQQRPRKNQIGGIYTLKEQRIRKKWLADDSLSGTLKYDQRHPNESVTSPYHYIPPQHASIPINTRSNSTWDENMARRKQSEDQSIEWTPQDSSYGAAVQAFGWVPKRIRKLLEVVFVVLMMALLIFVVVKTGIKLKSSGSGGGEDNYFEDDDHYEAFNDSSEGSESNDASESNDGSDESNDSADRMRHYI